MFEFLVALLELNTTANDGTSRGDFDRWAEMSVRVRKGGFIVETFYIRILGPLS